MNTKEISVDALIDQRGISPLARRLLLVCGLVVLVDGFDVQAIGFAASAMSGELGIPLQQFGTIFSAGLFGAMLGALLLGPLADRFGRKPMLLASVGVFAVFTLLTVFSTSISGLLIARFLAGVGLGGAIPNVISLGAEYVPRNKRGMAIGMLYAGFPVGGMVGGFTAAKLIPLYGWQSIFVIGSITPLVLAGVIVFMVPESWQFLLSSQRRNDRLRKIVHLIAPDISRDMTFVANEPALKGAAVKSLFTEGRARITFLLWVPFFMILLLLIVMVLWTPSLLGKAGISWKQAAIITALINLGSAVGMALIGYLIDKVGHKIVLPVVIVLGAACVASIGMVHQSPMLLAFFAVAGGFFVASAATGLLILAALLYPASIRATGVGWAYGIGRMGQVVGPIAAGSLLAAGFSVTQIFLFALVPAAFSIVAILMLSRHDGSPRLPVGNVFGKDLPYNARP